MSNGWFPSFLVISASLSMILIYHFEVNFTLLFEHFENLPLELGIGLEGHLVVVIICEGTTTELTDLVLHEDEEFIEFHFVEGDVFHGSTISL